MIRQKKKEENKGVSLVSNDVALNNTQSHTEKILEGVERWTSFYRSNPHRFARDYMNLKLKDFQKALLIAFNDNHKSVYIAARGQGKSFLLAVFCCIRCILYPGTKICIASKTISQSVNVIEKIQIELVPLSPLLKNEIRVISTSQGKSVVEWKNGSYIKVVTSSDTARGNRANILLVDEFRMVDKDVIETVLKKFLTAPRNPGYLSKKEYKGLEERNKQIYLTSAFFKSHWSYSMVRDCVKSMLGGRRYFVCGFPYQLSLAEGLLSRDSIEDEMSESGFSETKWSMEMETRWFGDSDGTFFDFESIAKNRKIKYPMLPLEIASRIGNNKKIIIQPKKAGEKRIMSCDLALMSSTKNNNDASAIFINQLVPTKANRYMNNFVYTESSEGQHTQDQALRIRKLYEEFSIDYIVIDVKGVGFGIADALVRDINDPDTGETYPALGCKNNKEWHGRCSNQHATKALWVVNADARFNSECAIMLRDGFKTGRIRLLETEYDGESDLSELKGFKSLSVEDKVRLEMPYVNTTLLVNELINLKHEETTGYIKILRTGGNRKDRYSSISYNYWVACQLEDELKKKSQRSILPEDSFAFRAPSVRNTRSKRRAR